MNSNITLDTFLSNLDAGLPPLFSLPPPTDE